MSKKTPAEWQLPPGVNRGLWDYLHDPTIAQEYDAGLDSSLLFRNDLQFADQHCSEPGALVDLGCGTGRALVHFARKGFPTVGVDLSREMLKVVGEKARAESLTVDRLHMSLMDLSTFRDDCFQYALCLFSTLGMVVGAENRRSFCKEVFRVLKREGRFILHVHNRWHNLRDPSGRKWVLGNTLRSWMGKVNAGDCVMPPHQGVGELTLHLFTRGEISSLLKACGFQIRAIQALSVTGTGLLRAPWFLGRARAYGYLIAAEKPA